MNNAHGILFLQFIILKMMHAYMSLDGFQRLKSKDEITLNC